MRFRIQPILEDDDPDEGEYDTRPITVEAADAVAALNLLAACGVEGTDIEYFPDDVVECTEFRFRVYRLDMTEEEKAIVHKPRGGQTRRATARPLR